MANNIKLNKYIYSYSVECIHIKVLRCSGNMVPPRYISLSCLLCVCDCMCDILWLYYCALKHGRRQWRTRVHTCTCICISGYISLREVSYLMSNFKLSEVAKFSKVMVSTCYIIQARIWNFNLQSYSLNFAAINLYILHSFNSSIPISQVQIGDIVLEPE